MNLFSSFKQAETPNISKFIFFLCYPRSFCLCLATSLGLHHLKPTPLKSPVWNHSLVLYKNSGSAHDQYLPRSNFFYLFSNLYFLFFLKSFFFFFTSTIMRDYRGGHH